MGLRRAAIARRLHHAPEVVARLGREHEGGREAPLPGDARSRLEQPHGAGKPDRRAVPVRARALVRLPAARSAASGRSRAGCRDRCRTCTRRTSRTSRDSRIVARQSKVLHDCWPGAKSLMTGNPERRQRIPRRRQGRRRPRHLGRADTPLLRALHVAGGTAKPRAGARSVDRTRAKERVGVVVHLQRRRGHTGSRRERAGLEPAHARALERARRARRPALRAGNDVVRQHGNPLDSLSRNGEFVLLYPGRQAPIPSIRLEQLRDGIEDWAIFDAVRRDSGAARVRTILGRSRAVQRLTERHQARLPPRLRAQEPHQVLVAALVARRDDRPPHREGAACGAASRALATTAVTPP